MSKKSGSSSQGLEAEERGGVAMRKPMAPGLQRRGTALGCGWKTVGTRPYKAGNRGAECKDGCLGVCWAGLEPGGSWWGQRRRSIGKVELRGSFLEGWKHLQGETRPG